MDESIIRGEVRSLSGVYKITNLLSGKCYIGSSKDLEYRKRQHLRKRSSNPGLRKDILELGKESFTFNVLEYCDVDTLIAREQYYIDKEDSCNLYNVSLIAGSNKGIIVSDETKKKLSLARQGRIESEETRQKRISSLKGHIVSEETRQKLREHNIGKKMSLESRLKVSEAGKGRIQSLETRKKRSETMKEVLRKKKELKEMEEKENGRV